MTKDYTLHRYIYKERTRGGAIEKQSRNPWINIDDIDIDEGISSVDFGPPWFLSGL